MHRSRFLSALCCCTLLAGCAPYTIRSLPQSRQDAQQFEVLDKDVHKKLVLVSARMESKPDGRIELTCVIRNRKNKGFWRPGFLWDIMRGIGSLFVRKSTMQEGPEWADIKVHWLGQDGIMVEETNWQPTKFPRMMDQRVTFLSMKTDVAGFRVYFRSRQHIR